MKLADKIALVCGGGQGIGRAIAVNFAREGADVGVADINGDGARNVAREVNKLGRRSLAIEADATSKKSVAEMVERILSEFARIDIVVNNQGGLEVNGRVPQGLAEEEEDDWDEGYKLNLKSHFLVIKEVAPHMIRRHGGKIVNIASVGAKLATTSPMIYSVSKAGVVNLTRALARELGPHNINVNAICPGLVYTPLWERFGMQIKNRSHRFADLEPRDIFLEMVKRHTLLRREQTCDDIAHAAVFLASEGARNITGQSLNVDGGAVFD